MKNFNLLHLVLFLTFLSSKTHAQTNPHSNKLPLNLTFKSKEVSIYGSFKLELQFMALDTIELNHILKITDPLALNRKKDAPFFNSGSDIMEITGNYFPGNKFNRTITVHYNKNCLPFFYKTLNIEIVDLNYKKVKSEQIFLFFTPYNTLEISNSNDFEDLKRLWDSPSNDSIPKRRYISKDKIPVSNLSDNEFHNDKIPKSYISIEGLAYSIPIREVLESDTIDEGDFEIDPDSKGKGYGKLYQAPLKKKTSNFRTWTGIISGNVKAIVDNDITSNLRGAINITGIEVTVMDKDNLGFGCLGIDDKLGTGYTDDNGNFSIPVNSNQRYKGGLFPCAREGDELEIYLIIKATTWDGTIQVQKRLGGIRSESVCKNSTFGWNYNQNSLTIRTTFENSEMKPQLLHWANQCRKFVQEKLAPAGFSLPGSAHPLFIQKNVGSGNFFLPGGFKSSAASILSIITGAGFNELLIELTNKDGIYITTDDENDEDIINHEFGHYLMWHMQNKSWINPLEASFASWDYKSNACPPGLAWGEGWAQGFGNIMDAVTFKYDLEAGIDDVWNYEQRRYISTSNGKLFFPEQLLSKVKDGKSILTNQTVLTHGYVSAFNIGATIFDLFDGSSNYSRYAVNISFDDDYQFANAGDDNVELDFLQICQPILNRKGPGGASGVFGNTVVIANIVEYFSELRKILPCTIYPDIKRVFMGNRISDFNTNPVNLLNTDDISQLITIDHEDFKSKKSKKFDYKREGTISNSYLLDQPQLNNPFHSYNVGGGASLAFSHLSDNLIVSNYASLSFNKNITIGYPSKNGHLPMIGSILTTDICGRARFNIDENGTMELGDNSTGNKSIVNIDNLSLIQINNNGNLIINDGSNMVIQNGGTLLIRSGATINVLGTGKITVQAGGYICIENGAILNFSQTSEIYLDISSRIGTNPALGLGSGSCNTNLNACINITGNNTLFSATPYLPVPIVSADINLPTGNSTVLRAGATGLSFDGVDDYLDGGDLGTFPDTGAISFWMDPFVVENYRNPFSTNYLGGNSGIRFEESTIDEKGFAVIIGDVYGNYQVHAYADVNVIKPNTWYHVILTWNKGTNRVMGYLNGSKIFEEAQTYWPSTLPYISIGSGYNSNRYWKGLIDDVGIYKTDISSMSDVLSSMQKPNNLSNLIAYWDLEEGTGLSTVDFSGNGYTATLKNGTSWVTSIVPITYTWSPDLGLNSTSGESVISNPASSTTYTVTATGNGYCTTTDTIQVNVVPALRMAATNQTYIDNPDNSILVYPNPATGNINVKVSGEAYKVEILDIQGRKLNEYNSSEETIILNVSNLHEGLYILQVIQNGVIRRKKLEILN